MSSIGNQQSKALVPYNTNARFFHDSIHPTQQHQHCPFVGHYQHHPFADHHPHPAFYHMHPYAFHQPMMIHPAFGMQHLNIYMQPTPVIHNHFHMQAPAQQETYQATQQQASPVIVEVEDVEINSNQGSSQSTPTNYEMDDLERMLQELLNEQSLI